MYFCPNCSYVFDIAKSSTTKGDDNRVVLDKSVDVFKTLETDKDLSKYKASFSIEELQKNKKYLKLSNEEKSNINKIFEDIKTSGAEFKCQNCNFTKPILTTTLLYKINVNDKLVSVKTLEENELTARNPILAHTNDYICKNLSCITHKKQDIKDSVFFKENNSYKLNYICCVCYYGW